MSVFSISKVDSYIKEYFSFLEDESFLHKVIEEHDEEYLNLAYKSQDLIFRFEKYRNELYFYIAAASAPEKSEANLYNVVEYINQDTKIKSESNYYRQVKDLDECFRLQIKWHAKVLKEYYPQIKEFYIFKGYKLLPQFMKERHPHLFRGMK